jgi:ribosomal-protein-alanine N-acetyltransferase
MTFIIETPRLRLERLNLKDAEAMFHYASDPEVTKYLTWPRHTSLEDARTIIPALQKAIEEGSNDGFAIHLAGAGMIGTVGMKWRPENKGEIGYVISREHWHKGIVTEAAVAFVAYLWEQYDNLEFIDARCFAGHNASASIMKKLGMKFLGFLPDETFINIHPEKKFPVWHYGMRRTGT